MEAVSQPAEFSDTDLQRKYEALYDAIAKYTSAITAFSGGVDSSLVAFLAHRILGPRALAVTSCSESLSREDNRLTRELAAEWGMAHHVIKTRETHDPRYLANPVQRCYFCKSTLYADLTTFAKQEGYGTILNGTNLEDLGDTRPGLRAAKEYGVRSPLAECGFTKDDIRRVASQLGLRNAQKPQAACLSSRVPYGLRISIPMLGQIEKAEQVVRRLGFSQLRVRHHGDVARIEVPAEELQQAVENREELVRELKALGYRYVTLDLQGFRSGSLNEGLKPKP